MLLTTQNTGRLFEVAMHGMEYLLSKQAGLSSSAMRLTDTHTSIGNDNRCTDRDGHVYWLTYY